jgi:hypothetical protein
MGGTVDTTRVELPNEVWEAVFGWLDLGRDLCAVAASCTRFRSVVSSPSLWRHLSRRQWRYLPKLPPPSLASFCVIFLLFSLFNACEHHSRVVSPHNPVTTEARSCARAEQTTWPRSNVVCVAVCQHQTCVMAMAMIGMAREHQQRPKQARSRLTVRAEPS